MTAARRISPGPFLWGLRVDVAVFGGSAALALALVAWRRVGGGGGELPPWAWLVFVLGVDVAHVYATLFRTYLDGDALRRHPWRYGLAPLAAYGVGVALYAQGPLAFWRVLAYVALFHFVRQQVGWAAVYRARDPGSRPVDARVDAAALYAATLYPVFLWHLDPSDKAFSWFVDGDFLRLPPAAVQLAPLATGLWALSLAGFVARQIWLLLAERRVAAGRSMIVGTTALIWYVGIAGSRADFDFTVTNVIVHGVPYVALLWSYTVARRRVATASVGAAIASAGIGAFVALLVALAFFEELLWDRLVFGDHGWLFGASDGPVGEGLFVWLVPLLSVPQATHYVLDGVLWRRRDTRENPAQRLALGFEP